MESIINNLKTDSAAGWDRIPTKFVKLAKSELIPVITHLGILSFQEGVFPPVLKRSVIHPIFKGGDRDNINNYRPISVLPVISKILEKLINNRLISFLNTYNLLSDSQYGFRPGLSTEDAILDLTKDITKHLDSKKKALCIFPDLKKAFDTVSVSTLISKLYKIGIRGSFLTLIRDYLHARTQRVKLDDKTISKDVSTSEYGVPQGSVLGPTLFLIYINDLTNLKLLNGRVFSYADDTALLFHDDNWNDVFKKAEIGLTKVIKWLKLHLLSLNTSKTNYIAFSIRDNTQPDEKLSITAHTCLSNNLTCNCSLIEKVKSTKYLGIIIDKNLSWYPQLELVANRARKLIWLLKFLRDISNKDLIIYIYKTLVQSILTYCLPIWGGTYKTKFIGIERAQRAILKVILRKRKSFSTYELYKQANVLTVRQLYILQCILRVHKNLPINTKTLEKRNRYAVIKFKTSNTVFASNQFCNSSISIYNKINRVLNLYGMTYKECKKTTTSWLKSLSYEDTEELLKT